MYNVHESISTTVYSICIFNVRVAVTVYLFRNDAGLAPGRELSVINQLSLGFKHLFHVYGYTYWYSVYTTLQSRGESYTVQCISFVADFNISV